MRRARWKPRISILGSLGGLLLGLSAVVLLQQYSLLYPTREILIGGLVVGLLVGGLLIPSLFRRIAVRRINRAVSRVERARQVAVPAAPPTRPSAPD